MLRNSCGPVARLALRAICAARRPKHWSISSCEWPDRKNCSRAPRTMPEVNHKLHQKNQWWHAFANYVQSTSNHKEWIDLLSEIPKEQTPLAISQCTKQNTWKKWCLKCNRPATVAGEKCQEPDVMIVLDFTRGVVGLHRQHHAWEVHLLGKQLESVRSDLYTRIAVLGEVCRWNGEEDQAPMENQSRYVRSWALERVQAFRAEGIWPRVTKFTLVHAVQNQACVCRTHAWWWTAFPVTNTIHVLIAQMCWIMACLLRSGLHKWTQFLQQHLVSQACAASGVTRTGPELHEIELLIPRSPKSGEWDRWQIWCWLCCHHLLPIVLHVPGWQKFHFLFAIQVDAQWKFLFPGQFLPCTKRFQQRFAFLQELRVRIF